MSEPKELAPESNLPSWDECKLRVDNSAFMDERVREGGYGADGGELLATPLHQFIYEYDDADLYRSDWFRHRLEKLIEFIEASYN